MKNEFEKKLKKISKLLKTTQQIVLGAMLSSIFKAEGVDFIIVGGAAVQFYTQATYTTKDLDVILRHDTTEIIEKIMGNLGFKRTTTYRHFNNPLFKFSVEFPPSPIEVGSRCITEVNTIQTNLGDVEIIAIEDIIMDRIIAGVEWKSERSLSQAKLLWQKNKSIIDKKYLKQFAKEEGYEETLRETMRSPRPASQGSR